MAQNARKRSSIRIARVGNIDIQMHWTFIVLVVLVVWANMGAGLVAVGASLVWIVAIFSSVLVHEYAHCVVARRRGAEVEDILLLPIGGVSQLKKMPERGSDELAIAIVGPLASLGVAVLAVAGGLFFHARLWPPTLFAGSWFARIAWLNIMLGGFNLLPALPMDGGRVLRGALERSHDRLAATRMAGTIARTLAMVMIVGGALYDFWFVLIGVFVYLGAGAEEQAAEQAAQREQRHRSVTSHPSAPDAGGPHRLHG